MHPLRDEDAKRVSCLTNVTSSECVTSHFFVQTSSYLWPLSIGYNAYDAIAMLTAGTFKLPYVCDYPVVLCNWINN